MRVRPSQKKVGKGRDLSEVTDSSLFCFLKAENRYFYSKIDTSMPKYFCSTKGFVS